jgi:hypothetical protein
MEQGGNRTAYYSGVDSEARRVTSTAPSTRLVPFNAVALGKVVRFKIVAIDKQGAVIACVRPLTSEGWDWMVELLDSSNAAC